jgi:DHA2 family multidrug resistance protein-like MFS transporter
MSHASAEHAGMAASIEEVGIELGGAIGVTVLGSILAGVYSAVLVLPNEAALPPAVRDGIDEALVVARSLPADAARQMTGAVRQAFDVAYFTALAVAAVLMVAVAVMARRGQCPRCTRLGDRRAASNLWQAPAREYRRPQA